ncbi:MAG: murein biosynthesis integral membrane protein MurJ, partial [Blastocatellia bacterium]
MHIDGTPAIILVGKLRKTTQRDRIDIEWMSKEPDREPSNDHQRLASAANTVSLVVMGSRVLGLAREQVFAYFFGAGYIKDAFDVAFQIPNTLRDLFAEGALSAAFVKTFSDYRVNRGEDEAWKLASTVFIAVTALLGLVSLAGVLLSPYIVRAIAPGFPPDKLNLSIKMTRIMFPFLLLVTLAAVAMAALNSRDRFGIPASASSFFNVGSIVGGLLFAFWFSGGGWVNPGDPRATPSQYAQNAFVGMAIGTLVGGALQFIVQTPCLWRLGFRFSWRPAFSDPGIRRILSLMAPAVLGVAAVQANVFTDTFFASSIPGGRGWLSYSFRLMQFPIGVFGVATGAAVLPALSRHAAKDDIGMFRKTLSSSLNRCFLLTVPSACGLMLLGEPIIRLLYQHGEFTANDTQMVTWALRGWAFGLVAYSGIKILAPAFYALDDPVKPAIVSVASIVVNAVTDYYFKKWLTPSGIGHAGLALSTSCVAITNFFVLAIMMRRKIGRIDGRRILSASGRVILAASFMSVTAYCSHLFALKVAGDASLFARDLDVIGPIAVGGAVFVLIAKLLNLNELDSMISALL